MICTATTYLCRILCSLLWLNPSSDSLQSGLFLVLPTTCLENHPQVEDQGAIIFPLPQATTLSPCEPLRLIPQHRLVWCHLQLVPLGPLDLLHPLCLMHTQDRKLLTPFSPLLCLIRWLVRVHRPSPSLVLLLLQDPPLQGVCQRIHLQLIVWTWTHHHLMLSPWWSQWWVRSVKSPLG
jgi:hypothetical protein